MNKTNPRDGKREKKELIRRWVCPILGVKEIHS